MHHPPYPVRDHHPRRLGEDGTVGSTTATLAQKRQFAIQSWEYNKRDAVCAELFPDLVEPPTPLPGALDAAAVGGAAGGASGTGAAAGKDDAENGGGTCIWCGALCRGTLTPPYTPPQQPPQITLLLPNTTTADYKEASSEGGVPFDCRWLLVPDIAVCRIVAFLVLLLVCYGAGAVVLSGLKDDL